MKKFKLIAVGIVLLLSSSIHAQVSVNVNIGSPPSWGPVGYADVGYYYLPDIEAYYDIRASQFIYYGGRSWVRSRYLPRQYRNYDLNSGYKVVLNDYRGSRPYTHFQDNRRQYYRGYKGTPQRTIGEYRREHRDNDYRKGNDHHREYEGRDDDHRKGNDHGRGNGHGNGKDHGKGNNGHGNGHGKGNH